MSMFGENEEIQDILEDTEEEENTNVREISTGAKLPATVSDLIKQRKNPQSISLADRIEQIYLRLYEQEIFKKYRMAIYKEDTVEGSFVDDDVEAAIFIRTEARKHNSPNYDPIVGEQKLSVLRRILGVVERRYKADRVSRRAINEDDSPRV